MSYLDETVPADSEAVTLGASRIRELKVNLDALIEQIFEDAGTFLPGWIMATGAAGGTSMFAAKAIQTADINDGAIGTAQLGALQVTLAKLAAQSVDVTKLVNGIVMPANSVNTASLIDGILSADTAGRAKMADGFVTPGKLSFTPIQAAVGSFAGSNSPNAINISSLAFNPNVLIFATAGFDGFGISFLSEAASSVSPIHVSWGFTATVSPNISAITWQAGGFVFGPGSVHFNQSGHTTYYLALAV